MQWNDGREENRPAADPTDAAFSSKVTKSLRKKGFDALNFHNPLLAKHKHKVVGSKPITRSS